MGWGNRTGAVKWTHLFNQRLFSNFNVSYSRYVSSTNLDFGGVRFGQSNSMNDFSLRGDLDFFWTNDHLFKIGIWWSQYRVTYSEVGDGDPYDFVERPAQISFYAQDEWKADERLTLQGGLRVEYQDLSKQTGLGPRFNIRYNIDEFSSIKFATGLYYQFLMAVPAGGDNGFSPFDIWVPINDKMTMSKSYDFVLGYETRRIEDVGISVETYYKVFRDLLNFKNEITYTKDVSDLFYVGSGRAFGAEFFLQKRVGDLTGMLGYTLAWTYRTFPDLNNGEEFEPKFDRRNDVSVAANYQLNEKWKFGIVYTYATGQAYTQGVGRYQVTILGSPYDITLPGKLFNHRLSPYHRMDISVTKRASLFGINGSWYFQIYNVYNRRNVWFKQFDNSKNPTEVTDVKLLPIIPTFGIDCTF
jgi:hypothetical protein